MVYMIYPIMYGEKHTHKKTHPGNKTEFILRKSIYCNSLKDFSKASGENECYFFLIHNIF